VWLEPVQNRENPTEGFYYVPLYKITSRAGTLSTTGHSTNYIMPLEIPSDKPQSHWTKRSVALFTMLPM